MSLVSVIWNFIGGQILSLYIAKNWGQYFTQIFHFVAGQYLIQITFQIAKQIGCVDIVLQRTFFLWPEIVQKFN